METEITSSTEAQNIVESGEREAIIFIPAIGKRWDDPSIEGVARRMAVAIDLHSKTAKAQAHVEVAEQEFGNGYKCKMFTITKTYEKRVRPLIDVFGLDYNDTLVEDYAKRNLFFKILLLSIALLDGFRRLIFRFYKRSKSLMEKIQLIYGLLVFGLLTVYLVILIAAVIVSFEQIKEANAVAVKEATAVNDPQNKEPTKEKTISPQAEQNALEVQQTPQIQSGDAGVFESLWSGVTKIFEVVWGAIKKGWNFIFEQRKYFPLIIILLTALGFLLPPKADIKEKISLAATNYLCLLHYLNWGERSHAIGGKLESLLEYLVERDKEYKKIHIIGYSFGSIVAIDNLFPSGRRPIDRFNRIDTLVTIGCPFDIIRTYWTDYFNERQSLMPNTPKWINVYSPIDILSSNFANGGNDQKVDNGQQQDIGVDVDGQIRKPESIIFSQGPYRSLGVIDILTLTGFRAHSMYWGEEFKGEISCFHDIVKKMYQDTPFLD